MKYTILLLLAIILINKQSFSQVQPIKINSSLEMYGKDLGLMNWDDANIECKKLGDGWRLPDKNELGLIIKIFSSDWNANESTAHLNQSICYWTSTTDANDKPFNCSIFFGGVGNYDYKNFQLLVRPVRSLSDLKLTLINENEPDASFIINNLEVMYNDLDLNEFKKYFDKKGINLNAYGYEYGEGYSNMSGKKMGYKFNDDYYDKKEFTFNSSKKIIELIGNGWRLPTIREWYYLYTNKSIIPNLRDKYPSYYISIDENNPSSQWVDIFKFIDRGEHWRCTSCDDRDQLSVRLVKDLNKATKELANNEIRTIKIHNLEIMTKDFKAMNFTKAMDTINKLGNGWRLPTQYEMKNVLFKFKNIIGGFQDGIYEKTGYWFLPESNDRNFDIFLFATNQPIQNWKISNAFVRLVRDINNDTNSTIINTKKVGNLEIMPNDIGKMNYEFAKFSSSNYGDGWRLPTNNELIFMYSNRNKIGKFSNNSYWSIEEINESRAGLMDFGKGILKFLVKNVDGRVALTGLKDEINYVRLVRTITTNGNIKFGNLEVYNHDLGKMNWEAAIIKCKELGNGWRLPTDDELNILFKNKNTITGLSKSIYWSSSKSQLNKARYLFMLSGVKGEEVTSSNFNVRPVRIIK